MRKARSEDQNSFGATDYRRHVYNGVGGVENRPRGFPPYRLVFLFTIETKQGVVTGSGIETENRNRKNLTAIEISVFSVTG